MKNIAIFTAGEGHLSIAQAIEQTLGDSHQVSLVHKEDPFLALYKPFYRYAPKVFKIPFELSKRPQLYQFGQKVFETSNKKHLQEVFDEIQPDVCISAYFGYTPALEDLCLETGTPLVNIMTDPRTIHPFIVSLDATINLAFDEHAVHTGLDLSPGASIAEIGWLVREEFEAEYDQKKVKKQLNIAADQAVVLVTAGSEGTTKVLSILSHLKGVSTPTTVIVACGANEKLEEKVLAVAAEIATANKNLTIQPLGFTRELHRYMQAADIVVGKAGPNSIFESAATLTPFFAITHVHGQEDGNLEIITQHNLGYVQEDAEAAGELLLNILRNPRQLNEFKAPLANMRRYNIAAKSKLRKLVRQLES